MINISKLTQKDVGRWVWYKPSHAPHNPSEWERGKIKSWNDSGVFVVYNANNDWAGDHWKDYTAAHTNANDLEFA